MSETTAAMTEAGEILAGRSASNGADLKDLEKQLSREGQDELARSIRRRRMEVDEKRAEAVLASSAEPDAAEMLKLAKRLAETKRIGLARRILKRTRATLERSSYPGIYLEIFQKSALYTYKDLDLPLDWRLNEALKILGKVEDLATTEVQETLGLAGAIHKRKWEVDGQRQHLERALFFYLRGYTLGLREEHVDGDQGKSRRPVAPDKTALQALRADAFRYLRENPTAALWAEKDRGYCGINAAFVLDLLAHEEDQEARRAGLESIAAEERRAGARLIREEINRSVPPLLEKPENDWLKSEWWFYATLGEAHFGLGTYDASHYDQAVEWLVERPSKAGLKSGLGVETPAGLEVPEWEYESTARQLARLARLHCDPAISEQGFEKTGAGKALTTFLGNDEKAVRSTFRGKLGLGLSGGGFRAALFHIGLLARLAELDALRHIEVLSCVSGGSIVGAHYYLEVRKLLERKSDDAIEPQDYIDIVHRIERDFLAGVQRNIRTRVLAEWLTNVRMIFSASYTRTLRVGELYERELYSHVEDIEDVDDRDAPIYRSPVTGWKWLPDWLARLFRCKREERFLNDLFINPKLDHGSRQTDFNPRSHNWRRKNKAPILILNATSLNTGHAWQFTASYMGEPPTPINRDIDANYRLRRMYYKDAPEKYRKLRLGSAVAASSCVPGLFEPLILDGLYPDDDGKLKEENLISVRLVDGGVCDNQGVGSLLEQDCTVMLVSDASGQMDVVNVPGGGSVGVLLRSSSISQARVREAQYSDVAARHRSSLLRGLMFIHLRQDLAGESVAWKDCPSSLQESEFESRLNRAADETGFGVATGVQRKLSALRTDLDSFNEAEAYALMASAYRMTERQLEVEKRIEGFASPKKSERWRFLAVEEAMRSGNANEKKRKHLERLLDAGASLAFKVWKLSPLLTALAWLLFAGAIAGLVYLFWSQRNQSVVPSSLTFGKVGLWIVTILLFAGLAFLVKAILGKKQGANLMRVIRWRQSLKDIAMGVGMGTVGFLAARIHLHFFDRLYLKYGRLEKFPK